MKQIGPMYSSVLSNNREGFKNTVQSFSLRLRVSREVGVADSLECLKKKGLLHVTKKPVSMLLFYYT